MISKYLVGKLLWHCKNILLVITSLGISCRNHRWFLPARILGYFYVFVFPCEFSLNLSSSIKKKSSTYFLYKLCENYKLGRIVFSLISSFRSSFVFQKCFPGGSEVKASAWNEGEPGSIPGLGRSPGERNGNPLQYSCLENPMDWEAW